MLKGSYFVNNIKNKSDFSREIELKQNEFLDVYSLYLKAKISLVGDDMRLKAYELHSLNSKFYFNIQN